MKNDNIFLKGLNELRAIAALGVLVHHVELLKSSDREALLNDTYSFADNKYFYDFIHSLGKNSVFFFFKHQKFFLYIIIWKMTDEKSDSDG